MNLNEAAALLQKNRDTLKIAISDGIELPFSKKVTKLVATKIGNDYEIEEKELNIFISAFEAEEPGRHPPAEVRRELLVEATHRCAICKRDEPIEFHHIVEFSQLKHYDTKHMIAICRNCHARCGLGEIDKKSQREYKKRLSIGNLNGNPREVFINANEPIRFSWDDLKVNFLNLLRELCEIKKIQHILTVIDSDLPRDDKDEKLLFSGKDIIKQLHDDGISGRLFKMNPF